MRNEECPFGCIPGLSLRGAQRRGNLIFCRARLDAVGADIIRPRRTHYDSAVFRRIRSASTVGAAFCQEQHGIQRGKDIVYRFTVLK